MIIVHDETRGEAAPPQSRDAEPPFAVLADIHETGGTLDFVVRGQRICSARAQWHAHRSFPRWLGAGELVIDRFCAHEPRVLREESAGGLPILRELLRRAATEPRWRWHVLAIVADSSETVVTGAAWRLAAELELGCEIDWVGTSSIGVRIFGPGIRSRIARAVDHAPPVASLGLAVRRPLDRLAKRIVRSSEGGLYVLDVDQDADGPRPPAGMTFREVSLSSVARRPMLYADSVQGAEEPLARGECCYIGERAGSVVFRMWVGRPRPEWLRGLPADARSASCWYIHDCHTIPSARGRGIYVAALRWLVARARAQAVRQLALHVASDNRPAIRAVEKAGFTLRQPGQAREREAGGLTLARPGVLELVRHVVAAGDSIRVRAAGGSMWPTIPNGALVELGELPSPPRTGQVVLLDWNGNAVLHRIVRVTPDVVVTCGDACRDRDPETPRERIVAVATKVDHLGRTTTLVGSFRDGAGSWARYAYARARLAAARAWRAARMGDP